MAGRPKHRAKLAAAAAAAGGATPTPPEPPKPSRRQQQQSARDEARPYTRKSVEALAAALEVPGERVAAATTLMAYGWGRPVNQVEVRTINDFEDLTFEERRTLKTKLAKQLGINLVEHEAEYTYTEH